MLYGWELGKSELFEWYWNRSVIWRKDYLILMKCIQCNRFVACECVIKQHSGYIAQWQFENWIAPHMLFRYCVTEITIFYRLSRSEYGRTEQLSYDNPDSKIHGSNMGPTWVLSAPDGPHVGPINLAIREVPPRVTHMHCVSHVCCGLVLVEPIYFRVTSVAFAHSCDCSCAREETWGIGEIHHVHP